MKKSDIVLIGVVVLLLIIAFLTTAGKGIEKVVLSGETGSNEISYSEYTKLLDDEKPFIVIIERATCGHCQTYMPIVKEVATEMGVSINYIDTDTLTEDEMSKLSESNDYLSGNQWGTPTTLLLKGKKVLGSLPGAVDKNGLEKFINTYVSLDDDSEEVNE